MIEEIKNIRLAKKDLKSFGFTFGIILTSLGTFFLYKGIDYFIYFLCIGLVFIGLSFITPIILKPVYTIWMTFGVVFGWIMTRLILIVLFYTVVTGIAILTRKIGKDFLDLKLKNKESYWIIRDSKYELNQDYQKQF